MFIGLAIKSGGESSFIKIFSLLFFLAFPLTFFIAMVGLVISIFMMIHYFRKSRKDIATRYAVYITVMIPWAVSTPFFVAWHSGEFLVGL